MASRKYTLPSNVYSGTVNGVSVSYNRSTERQVYNLRNLELKRYMEDAAVSAALSRGYYSVFIR
jgi:hypothetical protein